MLASTATPGVAFPSLGLQVLSSSEGLGLRKAQGGPTAGRLGHPGGLSCRASAWRHRVGPGGGGGLL